MGKQNIFVIGLDPFHLGLMRQVHHSRDYAFHDLLDYDEVVRRGNFSFERMLETAERRLDEFPDRVDAIIEHWDFPSSLLLPIICRRHGLRAPSLEAMLKCEHKYWSRLEQRHAVPELVPEFELVDPFDDRALEKVTLRFPFWLKPIKAFSSNLGFRIDDEAAFHHAITLTRRDIGRIAVPFDEALGHARLPPEIAGVGGHHCLAEALVGGLQCGVEGFVREGRFAVHGMVDCVKDPKRLSFTRYEYPSVWPKSVQRRMYEASQRLIEHIGYDNGAYCVEFFWEEGSDDLKIIEVNPRISQSHSDQFIKVEGASNHEVVIDIALGREPEFCRGEGKYKSAAKFLLRKYHNARVERVPSPAEIAAVEEAFEDSIVQILIEPGRELAELANQDSYSFEIANIYLGAQSQRELLEKYRQVVRHLKFGFSDKQGPEPMQFEWVRY